MSTKNTVHKVTSQRLLFAVLVSVLLLLTACASNKPYRVELMPSPDVFDDGAIDPFLDTERRQALPVDKIFYATDREPAGEDDRSRFYNNQRGKVVRLGVANVKFVRADISWEEARDISLAKNRTDKYPIQVSSVEEFGILDRTIREGTPSHLLGENPHTPAKAFADAINAKLAKSKRKDIYIYTHGYKVIFDNPLLVTTELWHFLGYDGVFIAYAWPSTPSKWAYFRDLDTAVGYARNLRIFLEYLADETDAERIHILGYSAGTKLVARVLEQLALMNHERSAAQVYADLRLDHVILVGSDIDREVFGTYLADGLLKVPRHLSIYMSEKDKALKLSRFFTGRERLGQMWAAGKMDDASAEFLHKNEAELSVINVTRARGATAGNGHGYFRRSPWASSDILVTLAYDLPPAKRGLVLEENVPVWKFPEDYIEQLRAALIKINPKLGKHLQTHTP